jgi:serine/threonine protein kinase
VGIVELPVGFTAREQCSTTALASNTCLVGLLLVPVLYCRSIRRGAYAPLPKTISADARDLVKRLLTVDPAARITWDQLSRHPWLGRQPAQQRNRTSSCIGAACSGDGSVCGSMASGCVSHDGSSTAGVEAIAGTSGPASLLGCSNLTDGSTSRAAASGASSSDSSVAGGWNSAQPSADGLHSARQALDSSCGLQLPQRSAVSFTSASCHDSVRVVIADSSRGGCKFSTV